MKHAETFAEQLAFGLTEDLSPHDSLWRQISENSISTQDAIEQAQQIFPELSRSEIHQRLKLFAPPNSQVMGNELATILSLHEPDNRLSGSPGPDRPSADLSPIKPMARPVSTRSRNSAILAGSTAVGLAAAAALVLVMRPGANPGNTSLPAPPHPIETPNYQLEWKPWQGPMLGPQAPQPHSNAHIVNYHNEIVVGLRPVSAVHHEVQVGAWAESSTGMHKLDLKPVRATEKGFIRIQQSVAELGLTPGDWTLTFIIGPQQRLSTIETPVGLATGVHAEMVVLRDSVTVVE